MEDNDLIYLDTYVLQQDMRVRMPKSILENLGLVKGKSKLKIYYDKKKKCITMKAER
jgi:hypothetical protein